MVSSSRVAVGTAVGNGMVPLELGSQSVAAGVALAPPSAFDEGLARVQQFVLRQRSCVSRREGSDSIRWEPDESDSNQGQ